MNKKSFSNLSTVSNSSTCIPNMGNHLILDFNGVSSINLNNFEELDNFLTEVITTSGATIESKQYKIFEPQGVTILYLLSESHFSIHTWPEKNACAIDFYHCGDTAEKRLRKAEELICNKFGWENCTSSLNLGRGNKTQFLMNSCENYATVFKDLKFIHQSKSEFQDIRVYESNDFGKMISFNNIVKCAEKIDDHFTNDLTNLIMNNNCFEVENLLIFGGADLKVPYYLLENYPRLKNVTVVEIDNQAIEVSEKFMDWAQIENKNKLKVVNKKAIEFIQEAKKKEMKFDGIIIDNLDLISTDSIYRSTMSQAFFKSIFRILKKDGSFSQVLTNDTIKEKFENYSRIAGFKEITTVFSYVPIYSSTLSIGVCRKF